VRLLKSLLERDPNQHANSFRLWKDTRPQGVPTRETNLQKCRPADGRFPLRQLTRPNSIPLQVFARNLPPRRRYGARLLVHEGEEAGVVISGEIEVTVMVRGFFLEPWRWLPV